MDRPTVDYSHGPGKLLETILNNNNLTSKYTHISSLETFIRMQLNHIHFLLREKGTNGLCKKRLRCNLRLYAPDESQEHRQACATGQTDKYVQPRSWHFFYYLPSRDVWKESPKNRMYKSNTLHIYIPCHGSNLYQTVVQSSVKTPQPWTTLCSYPGLHSRQLYLLESEKRKN